MLSGAFAICGADLSAGALDRGEMLCLLAAAAYAGWSVTPGRQAVRHGRPMATTLLHCVMAAVLALPYATTVWAADVPHLLAALPEVPYLGVLSMAVAFLLIIAAQSRVSASVAVLLTGAESLSGAAGGIPMLGEVPGGMTVLGALLILAAVGTAALWAARTTLPARAGAAG
jgi:drug/metabolite transporter (DMT)-like permease